MSDLTELGQVLHEEHFRILVAICGLENRISDAYERRPLDPSKADERKLLDDLVVALEDVIGHHAFEERVIFPLIHDHGKADLARLLAVEHGAIEPMAMRLRTIAQGILAHGTDLDGWAEFRLAASALIDEVLQHLQKEELNIVQHMDSYLDPDTDHKIAVHHLAERLQGRAARLEATL